MTAAAGFFFASQGNIDLWLLILLLIGIALIIASACVLNNFIDRDIDSKMARTKTRALVTGEISVKSALIYASILGILGYLILYLYTNLLTLAIGLAGMFSYVVLYGYFKRRSIYGTHIGSISGSTSLIAGYCAVTGRFDLLTALLFIIMSLWQMPHFFAIGIYKYDDYKNASLPVLPVVRGIKTAKKQILYYIVAFMAAVSTLTVLNYAGVTYLVVMLIAGALWLRLAIKGFKLKDDFKYGHQIFGYSLINLIAFSLMISVDHLLP